ncbi:MAG TPA: carboxypeptidase regulatory-like domain-containing protein [Thermoanaerobaculia bacterium]|jgi:outer membrane receptor protein involved in Fe transport|nr:carboxypeptidase regulatory-like domain-containing protein [Thermoanaerobaculia bacterium]
MHSALALIVLLFQTLTTATVGGRVVLTDGTPIPGVTVTITETERNTTATAVTDVAGRFRFPPLAPGSYTLATRLEGLKTQTRKLQLTLGQVVDLSIPLSLASVQSEITIAEPAPIIETARTQIAATVTPDEVRQLPLNGRNYLDLALLAPGVSRTNSGANQRFAETSAVPGTGISVSTQRNLNNSFLVDGLSSNDDAAELAGTFYSQEVIREFQVIRSAGMAEFGRASGGVINVVTQAGTNTLRGDAYGFFRSQRLDADNPLTGSTLPLHQQQYGTSLGGPVRRDRTWFFTNFEQLRQRGGGVITIAPSAVSAINARLDAAGYRGARLTTGAFGTTLDSTNAFLRLDQSIGSDSLTLRFNSYDVDSANARNAGGLNALSRATALGNHDRTLAASYLAVLSEHTLSETRAQLTRSRLDAPTNDAVGPAVNIAGIASFGVATFSPTARDIDLYELAQNGSWYRGAHALKAGVDLLRNNVAITFPGALQGVYTFRDLPSFLAGNYASFQQAFGEPATRQRNDNFAAFVQDEWRATPRLTVNAGLRYDVQRLPSLVHTDRNNLSPRFAAAWDVRGDGRSVLRAGAGIYYDRIPLRAVANALQRNGVTYRIAQVGPGALTFPNVFAAFPSGLVTNITTIDAHIENSRSEQAMLQYERQLGEHGSVAIGYEHLRGRDLIMSRNINAPAPAGRPDPAIGNNGQFQSIGDSWYDGFTLSATWRPELRLSYTFSKGLDTSGNFFFSTPQDNNDIRAERGRSDNDQRHRLTLSGTLAGPAGLQFSYLYAYTSALPFNIQLPNDRNGDTNFNDRPPGVGRNTGRGFDYQSLDLRLSCRFGRIEAIVDAFNVLNRTNYQVPNNIITSPTFGQPTAVNDPRQLQLGLRVTY